MVFYRYNYQFFKIVLEIVNLTLSNTNQIKSR